jgi:hypothetical protein
LLALRSSETLPNEPIEAMRDYFGAFRSPEWDEVSRLEVDMEQLKEDNENLKKEMQRLEKLKIDTIEMNRIKEQERLQKIAEEEAKKTKKGTKK